MVNEVASSKNKKSFVHYLPMWGAICTGILYGSIGVIAILSFLKLKHGGADEGSFLVFLDQFYWGKLFIGLIMIGMIGYIVWRFYEVVANPYHYGHNFKGIMRRSVSPFSSLADALIAYSAIQALFGFGGIEESGQPTAQRKIVGNMLQKEWGNEIILTIGILTAITAIIQFIYVFRMAYLERMDIGHLSAWKKTAIHILAWSGHFARGIILGIIGFFFIKAGDTENAHYVVNTDKAFDFIGDHVGHFYFIIVALGTICYGLFMTAFGFYYDSG